ncbi:MAG: MaoC family dehydratase [Pseudomonadota bacterium]|nr:MaoC family dehydratase [Pseudomonadota bacterium]
MSLKESLGELKKQEGMEIHVSEWLEITQDMINEFGRVTGDMQWIHTDPERAKTESPYSATIAHGYFTLSLYPQLRNLVDESKPIFPNVKNIINYGINKLRFPGAVTAGSRIRSHSELISAEEIKNSIEVIEKYTVEVEGQDRPACVAECIMRLYF